MIYIPVLAAVSVFLLLMSFPKLFKSKKTRMEERISTMVLEEIAEPAPSVKSVSLKENMHRLLDKASTLFAGRGYTEKLQIELISAGINLKGEEFITIWIGITIFLPVMFYILFLNFNSAILAFFMGLISPRLYIRMAREKRIKQLTQQLGDALVVMANSLRAGFGLQQAMDVVRNELPLPISQEFGWTIRDINLGSTVEEALKRMSSRAGSDDLDMMVTAILVQRQVGGNLAVVLDNISETIRERTRIKREIRTLTAQGRMSGLIIGLMPVVLYIFISIINPDYMRILTSSSLGIAILIGAAFSELLGLWIIRRIIDIKV
ncbi:MAG: type II secretion system F family protein [Methylocystaceae bacterium]